MTHQTPPSIPEIKRIAFSLTIPAPDPIEHPHLETRPAQVRQWVELLPSANPERVADALFDPIYHLNRDPKPLPQLPELMACYQAPFNTLVNTLQKESEKKANQSMRQRQAALGTRLIKICTEIAYGHKRIIRENLQEDGKSSDLRQLGISIYFALKALTLELMIEYADFIPSSKKAWREIGQLFWLAEQYDLLYQPIEVDSTIDLLFKRIVLITLIDPYRMQRSEAWGCFDYLRHWGAIAKISPITKPKKASGFFLIDLGGMQPPSALDLDKPLPAGQHRLLNTAPLNQLVHSHLTQFQSGHGTPPEGTERQSPADAIQMFRHMLLAWHVRPQRRSPRQEKYTRHPAACGLSAVNHFLREGELALEGGQTPTKESDSFILDASLVPKAKAAHYKIYNWRLFNKSAGGVGIIISAPFPEEMQVGQLILLALEEGQDKHWPIGVVRRMIQREENILEIGVQFIQGDPCHAAIRPDVFGRDMPADFQPGLALERKKERTGVLLAPRGMYEHRREYVVDMGERVIRVYADKLVESTPIFDRFEYVEMVSQRAASMGEAD